MTKITIPSNFKSKIKYHYPLGQHTWYKIGGNADVFIEPANLQELTQILKILSESNTPVHIFGKGANILIDDDGINGAVVSLSNPTFNKWNIVESINHLAIKVGAGCDLFTLVKKTSQQGLDAFIHLTGIPGTIGGAIAMNAGGKWGETFDNLVDITVMSPKGEINCLNKNEVNYGYRNGIKDGSLILEATFATNQIEPQLAIKKWRAIFNEKKKTQPLGELSPGCAFQNPLNSKGNRVSAGKLIEECNLKSTSYGEVQISSRHANFLIAKPNAPTSDVLHLMKLIQQRVIKKHDIWLEPEVIIWNRHQEEKAPIPFKKIIQKITVLRGGPDREHSISMSSGKSVINALKKNTTFDVIDMPFKNPTEIDWQKLKNTIVFPVLHGKWGEGGELQKKLENNAINFIGFTSKSSEMTFDKITSKKIASEHCIQTPKWKKIDKNSPCPFKPPFIIKPSEEGSSIGVYLITEQKEWDKTLKLALSYKTPLIAEHFIKGREFTIGFVLGELLSPIEIITPNRIYNYEAKYKSNKTKFDLYPNINPKILEKMMANSHTLLNSIGARDIARIDFLVNEEGPWFLEINSMPGFTPQSLLPKMAARDGLIFEDLCEKLIKNAQSRANSRKK